MSRLDWWVLSMDPDIEIHDCLRVEQVLLDQPGDLWEEHVLVHTTKMDLAMYMWRPDALVFYRCSSRHCSPHDASRGQHGTAEAILARV